MFGMFGIRGMTGVPGGGNDLSVTSAFPNAPPWALVTRPLTVPVCAEAIVEMANTPSVPNAMRNLIMFIILGGAQSGATPQTGGSQTHVSFRLKSYPDSCGHEPEEFLKFSLEKGFE